MFRPHTAIFRCYSILSRSWCSVMPIFAYVMLPAMCFSWWCAYCLCPFVRIFVLSLWPPCCLQQATFWPLGVSSHTLLESVWQAASSWAVGFIISECISIVVFPWVCGFAMADLREHRVCIKFCFKLGKTGAETHQILKQSSTFFLIFIY
jgi:hypothetical protein